ncbi:MAG: Crp/Fnr family transcriptional regulator [Planctomycetes bacterium]|jgi:CRP/FNR family transcriptional regulator|nr:Crp/Fnr family transcriptional regulator [Planctomycetota bacterium]
MAIADRSALLDLLSRSPLFRGLPGEDLSALAGIVVPRVVAKGEPVFLEGAPSEGFFLVFVGKVKIVKLSPAGKEQTLHVHGRGEPFAEAALEEGARYPATAIAVDDSRVVLVPRREFQRLLAKRPAIATNLIARLSQRIRQLVALVEDLALREAPARLARYLLDLAGEGAEAGAAVMLPIRKVELAALLGTRQETLSRALRKLADRRVIRVRGAKVTLLDPNRLADLAAGETADL